MDGHPLPGSQDLPEVGPCAVLRRGGRFVDACVENHASAAERACELRRPFIFSCHARLAGWAVPVLQGGESLPMVIICGGVLLTEPDSALNRHIESVAIANEIDPAVLMHSLDSLAVIPRERLRAIAYFLFELSNIFVARVPSPAEPRAPSPPLTVAPSQIPILFPPVRTKQTKKAKLRQAAALVRQSKEAEVVRLMRERKSDEALQSLRELLDAEKESIESTSVSSNLNVAETFSRLFRNLAGNEEPVQSLVERQSRLIQQAASEKTESTQDTVGKLCRKFVSIAEEVVGEPRPRQVRSIQKFLEKNLSKKLTLGAVSGRFGVKENALTALMLKYYGMSFTDYVASLRVAEAKRLLQATDLSFSAIARRTGFKDQSYFTKVFKSHLGCTPTEFRLQGQGGDSK